ncbi:50S ribosomal protein L25 [candidate division WWE3 bacterium CG08_land_8_20_14_0_20_43_13]|uniref:Large ribosomal subunit protein bL25 n=1 Tax=candidate division WWE3 bacterium CG08_land_8_20_14_0_20_43_13 TaxID=1975087 RepID=A0A2H0X7C8_UNCKA|nr:MAG: 50S ribosomal protein L25 [candidate division WWE3 bacterium CG08_land_8_20_14_0_20_43_13]
MELIANKRDIKGKKVKVLRTQGRLPGVVFGKKIGSIPIWVEKNDLLEIHLASGETGLISLNLEGQTYAVLAQSFQIDPSSRQPLHVDFLNVDLNKRVKIEIPLEIVGESPAVSLGSGLLLVLHDHLEVECLPKDIPSQIEVDVSRLEKVDDGITISQLGIDHSLVKVDLDQNDLVVKIEPALMAEEPVLVDQAAPVEDTESKLKEVVGKEEDKNEE